MSVITALLEPFHQMRRLREVRARMQKGVADLMMALTDTQTIELPPIRCLTCPGNALRMEAERIHATARRRQAS